MSSTQEGSNTPKCGRRNSATKQTRRSWSPREEAVLLAFLKEFIANGWKSDNGFRGGYLQRLEEAMFKEFPGRDIQASPHITSKLSIWKNYYSLTLMLKGSGVGFNADGKHTIQCEDEQWGQIVKCDLNAKNMRDKSWPMFEDWKAIFGKDRATGENAEDLLDAVNDMTQQSNRGGSNKEDKKKDLETAANEEDISFGDVGENSVSYSEKVDASVKSSHGKSKGKKRSRAIESVAGVVEVFCEISRGTNSRLEMVAQRIGHEYDMDQAKRDGFNQLENIPGLSLRQKFTVADIFAHNYPQLLVFQGLPENDRAAYVQHLLNQN